MSFGISSWPMTFRAAVPSVLLTANLLSCCRLRGEAADAGRENNNASVTYFLVLNSFFSMSDGNVEENFLAVSQLRSLSLYFLRHKINEIKILVFTQDFHGFESSTWWNYVVALKPSDGPTDIISGNYRHTWWILRHIFKHCMTS